MSGTNPGYSFNFRMEKFDVEEQRIIRRLAQDWYVTNDGGELVLGATSKYKYFLLKPSDRLKEILNFEREIIAIFSNYARFEPRTLDAFDAASLHYESHRLERICQILISKDA